jgi:pimeloyl-ACP methyl ester carboxylesterase
MSDTELDVWIDQEFARFMKTADESRFRHVLQEEARILQARDAPMMRSYESNRSESGDTIVIAFGGLQQHVGGGRGGGVPPYEFVRSCCSAGARYALFVRDPTRCWYCRGLGDGASSAIAASHSFEQMVEVLREEIAAVRPRRIVTIGSSMGGYAAIRAGLLLNADIAVAFSPQVFIDPNHRRSVGLRRVPIDDNLEWLQIVAATMGYGLPNLVEAVRSAPTTARTRLEVHVGGLDANDVREAQLLRAAVEERAQLIGHTSGLRIKLAVHHGSEHNLVVELRDKGQLHEMLRGWLASNGHSAR